MEGKTEYKGRSGDRSERMDEVRESGLERKEMVEMR